MKDRLLILTPLERKRAFRGVEHPKRGSNASFSFKFVPKELLAMKRYDVVIHAGEIQIRLIGMMHVLAEGTLLISISIEEGLVFEGELRPWNHESFEVLSGAKDELITLLLSFRKKYPREELVAHLSLDSVLCASS